MRSHGVYAITPEGMELKTLENRIRVLLDGGIAMLQFRNKTSTVGEKRLSLLRLHPLCKQYQVPLIVNDELQLAAELDLAGVHLGQTDSAITHCRSQLGAEKIIGISCHNNLELAVQAQQDGASYVSFGRFFTSRSKPGAPPADLNTLIRAKQQLQIPLVAIGGIDAENAAPLVHAGADYLALIAGLFNVPEPMNTLKRLNAIFGA